MAVLAIGLVGGFLAQSIGMSFGLGMAIFGSIAQLLLAPRPPKPTFRAMTSAWGETWPIIYNTFRVAGQVIQVGPVNTQKGKKKIGGKSPPTYTQTFCVGFCEGPKQVGRIWADNKVIYDPRPITDPPPWQANHDYASGDIIIPTSPNGWQLTAANNGESGATEPSWNFSTNAITRDGGIAWVASKYKRRKKVGKQFNFTMRINHGDETQLPDPALEALVGTGRQPAYRGLVNITFEDFNITKWGGRIPNIEAEILPGEGGTGNAVWHPMQVPDNVYGSAESFDPLFDFPISAASMALSVNDGLIFVPGCYGDYFDSVTGKVFDQLFSVNQLTGEVRTYISAFDSMVLSGRYTHQDCATVDPDGNLYLICLNDFFEDYSACLSQFDPDTLIENNFFQGFHALIGKTSSWQAEAWEIHAFRIDGVDYVAVLTRNRFSNSDFILEVIECATFTSVAWIDLGRWGNGAGINLLRGEVFETSWQRFYTFVLPSESSSGVDAGSIYLLRVTWFGVFLVDEVIAEYPMPASIEPGGVFYEAGLTNFDVCISLGSTIVVDPKDNGVIVSVFSAGSGTNLDATGAHLYYSAVVKLSSVDGHVMWVAPTGLMISGFPRGNMRVSEACIDVSEGVLQIPCDETFWDITDIDPGDVSKILPPYAPTAGMGYILQINTATGATTVIPTPHLPSTRRGTSPWLFDSTNMSLTAPVRPYGESNEVAQPEPNAPDWYPYTVFYTDSETRSFAYQMSIIQTLAGEGTVTLGDIHRDIHRRVGLTPDQGDYTGLDPIIPDGAGLLTRETGRSFLESMMPAYFHDLVDIGPKIVGTLRSNSAVLLTIPEDHLAAGKDISTIVDKLSSTRGNDFEIPRDLSLSYYDSQHDYQQNAQQARRNDVTTYSSGRNTTNVPVVMTPGEAADAAARALALLWVEREQKKFTLPTEYAKLTPADVIDIIRGTRTHRTRITRATLDPATMIISGEGVSEDFGNYKIHVSPPIADIVGAGDGGSGQAVQPVGPPVLALIDSPPLTQADIQIIGIYVAGCVSDGGVWDGMLVNESFDGGSTYDQEAILQTEATMGTIQNAIGDWPRFTIFDDVNFIDVKMLNGELLSTPKDNLTYSNANLAWLSTGEIIQFMTATLLPDGETYRLTGLRRGRFGTEQYIGTSQTSGGGEMFVLLVNNGALQEVTYPASDVGQLRYFEGINDAPDVASTGPISMTMQTRRLMPWAPFFIKGSRDTMTHDLTITGKRRMRWKGTPLWTPPETDTPVTVEIDIFNGGTVVRTLTSTLSGGGSGITDPVAFTAIYTDADQIADFGSAQSSVKVKAYSRNAIVGRGYPGSATV